MADTQFGIEIDGQKVTIVEVLNDTAVSIRSVSLDNLEDSISLLLAGIKDDNQQAKIRAMLSIPKTAMRRIDVTSNLTSRKEFEDAVYNKLTVSRENTTVAGVFFRPELMDGDTISPGVAVVAPLDPVNAAYRAFGRRDVELVAPPLAYRGWDGLWLALRYETAELTLVKDNRAVAYRQMQIGGLNSLVGLLGDPSEPAVGLERLESALSMSGLEDPIANAELDRYLRKVLTECQSTIRFWKQSGEETGTEIFAFGPGANTAILEPAINEAGFTKVTPAYVSKQLAFLPQADREVAVSAWCSAISAGFDMPQAAYINTSILEFKDKDAKTKLVKTGLVMAGVAIGMTLIFGGIPYFIGLKSKIDINNDYNKILSQKSDLTNDIKLYNEIKNREQLVKAVQDVEPNWAQVVDKSLAYLPSGGAYDSIQASRNGNLLTVTVNATFKGNAYGAISIWLDDISNKGGASQAWMTNFSVRENKTTCQVNYSIPLSKVKLIAGAEPEKSTTEIDPSTGNTNSSTEATNPGSVNNNTTQPSTGGNK